MEHPVEQPTWNLLQVSDVLDLEFASALAERVPVLAWEPQRLFRPGRIAPGSEQESSAGSLERFSLPAGSEEPGCGLRIRSLPLLRGFARAPLRRFARTGPKIVERFLRQTADPERTPLICTVPYFAEVAELWPGPVIYWLTDLIAEYAKADRAEVMRLDRRMCAAATLLCPNSLRLQQYLVEQAGADAHKVQILPNATRASNVLPTSPTRTGRRPAIIEDVPGPIAGIIGNLAGNMDWALLESMIASTPWLHWIFVGPVSMTIDDPVARRTRDALMQHPRTHFVGRQPYGELASFARAFDVAVLPYRRCEPTYSGSSTRFYEHLAACRPMIATPGLEELTRKEPLLTLVETADEAILALQALRLCNFDDGLLEMRWRESQFNTWQSRAQVMQHALESLLQPRSAPEPAESMLTIN
jgi:glycosyltransferase involved in cell wall biosynthesis